MFLGFFLICLAVASASPRAAARCKDDSRRSGPSLELANPLAPCDLSGLPSGPTINSGIVPSAFLLSLLGVRFCFQPALPGAAAVVVVVVVVEEEEVVVVVVVMLVVVVLVVVVVATIGASGAVRGGCGSPINKGVTAG